MGCEMSYQPTVLVIQNDVSLSQSISPALSQEGYQVILAQGGREGLSVLDSQRTLIDIVLTDLVMPDLDGFDVLEHVQKHYPDLPVIVVTADAALSSAIEALRLGAYDFLLKPLNMTAVQTALARALERKQLLEASRKRKRLEIVLQQAQKVVRELREPFAALQKAVNRLPSVVQETELQHDLATIREETERVADSLRRISQIACYETVAYLDEVNILDLDRATAPQREANQDPHA